MVNAKAENVLLDKTITIDKGRKLFTIFFLL